MTAAAAAAAVTEETADQKPDADVSSLVWTWDFDFIAFSLIASLALWGVVHHPSLGTLITYCITHCLHCCCTFSVKRL